MNKARMRLAQWVCVAGLLGLVSGICVPATALPSGLEWEPPTLSSPTTVYVSNANRDLVLNNATDYRLVMTSPVTAAGGLVISGGRNVVLIGGQISVPSKAVAPTDTARRGLYLKGQTGTIHVEGLHITGADLSEGINLDERLGATVQLENIRIDTVHGSQATNHADLIQTWAGPRVLRIDGLSGSTEYQGLFLLGHQMWSGETSPWDFRNIDITGTPESGYFLWKEDDQAIALDNVNVRRSDDTTNKLAWPNTGAWSGMANTNKTVLRGTPGMSYMSPGYGSPIVTTTTTTTSTTSLPGATTSTTLSTTTTSVVPFPPTVPPVVVPIPSIGIPTPTPGRTRDRNGFWMASADGGVFAMGDAGFYGSTGAMRLNQPVVSLAATSSRNGYWLVASDGGVFSFGDAPFYGSTGSIKLNKPVVGMASTPSGRGYWMVASDGGIFAFGDAGFYGSTGATPLNKPVVGMASTPTGKGYWLVASDGGIFAFGDARFFGSTGNIKLNQPVVAMSSTASGNGYRFIAADGGVFSFGDASFLGSAAGSIRGRAASLQTTASGNGYWILSSDGWVGSYGDAPQQSSMNGPLNAAVIAAAAL